MLAACKTSGFLRFAGGLAAAVLMAPAAEAQSLVTLHSFAYATEGGLPATDMILDHGSLVGTTVGGGTHEGGTLFRFKLSTGTLTPLYQFGRGPDDGIDPGSRIDLSGGVYYGTTYMGGTFYADGTSFGISAATGKEVFRTIFTDGNKGGKPYGGLTGAGGYLFGTASQGCALGAGCVFRLNPVTSQLTVVYNFSNGADGGYPLSYLLRAGKFLYGTTQQGGAAGFGTVYAIDSSTGLETVVYSFKGGADGEAPVAGVSTALGLLYGVTDSGGTAGLGTVFSLDPATGTKTILHSFLGAPGDGARLNAPPTLRGGALYGVTANGGASDAGAVWSVSLASGQEKLLYSFSGGADGGGPQGQLLYSQGVFYGTTEFGGYGGEGTIFALRP